MPTVFVKGDLFHHAGLQALAHGCNCAGAMGKGIATEFRRRFPDMYLEYKERCSDGRFKLGDVFTWKTRELTVFNLGTQRTWRTPAELGAIDTTTRAMVGIAQEIGIARVGLPRIGAGLGGLDWADVRGLLTRIGDTTTVELVVFEDYKPASGAS